MTSMRRWLSVLLLVPLVLAACGGSTAKAPPGSAQHPLVGDLSPEALSGHEPSSESGAPQPGFQKILERQTSRPKHRFSPCNLVTKAQAGSILGAAMRNPFEAPQGPTCIYRTRRGNAFITLAVQSTPLATLERQLHDRRAVPVSRRTAYCGTYGQQLLYLRLSGGRVLTVTAPCALARQFALTALGRATG